MSGINPIQNVIPTQNTQNFMNDYLQGLKYGQELQAMQKQDELLKKQELFKQDYATLSQNPSGQGMLNLMVKYPEFAAQLKPVQEAYGTAEKQGDLSQLMQLNNALHYGNTNLAKNIVESTIKAYDNSGKNTSQLKVIQQLIEQSPEQALGATDQALAMLLGDKYKSYAEGITESQTRPLKVKEMEGKVDLLKAQTGLEKEKTAGEANKNLSAKTAQVNGSSLVGISTALANNNPNEAYDLAVQGKANAEQNGLSTDIFDKAIKSLTQAPTADNKPLNKESLKSKIDSELVGLYGKDAEKIMDFQTKQIKQPFEIEEQKANAEKASIAAKYEEQLKQLDIRIKKANIAESNAGTDVKRQQLKNEKLNYIKTSNEIGEKKNENLGRAQSAYASINNASSSVDTLITKINKKDWTIPPTGTFVGRFTTLSDATKAMENDIQNVKNSLTLLKAAESKGILTPMSDTDVEIIKDATNSLSIYNSPEENKRQLEKIKVVIKNRSKGIQQETGYDQFQAENTKPYIHKDAKSVDSKKTKKPFGDLK